MFHRGILDLLLRCTLCGAMSERWMCMCEMGSSFFLFPERKCNAKQPITHLGNSFLNIFPLFTILGRFALFRKGNAAEAPLLLLFLVLLLLFRLRRGLLFGGLFAVRHFGFSRRRRRFPACYFSVGSLRFDGRGFRFGRCRSLRFGLRFLGVAYTILFYLFVFCFAVYFLRMIPKTLLSCISTYLLLLKITFVCLFKPEHN